jgi:hypothetical protein
MTAERKTGLDPAGQAANLNCADQREPKALGEKDARGSRAGTDRETGRESKRHARRIEKRRARVTEVAAGQEGPGSNLAVLRVCPKGQALF